MAISFDESNDYYTISDAAELTLQDGDWCIGIWTYVSDNTGSDHQYLISTDGTIGNNNAVNLWLSEASHATYPDQWSSQVVDGDGTTVTLRSSSSPGADSTWRLVVVQRDASENEIQMYFCESGGSASKEASGADTNFGAANPSDWHVARRKDGDADRYYGSIACELFKGNFALTSAQIEALAGGLPVKSLAKGAGLTLDLYLPMWEADATLLDYSNSGNDATRQDAPATSTHAPICTPIKRRRMG